MTDKTETTPSTISDEPSLLNEQTWATVHYAMLVWLLLSMPAETTVGEMRSKLRSIISGWLEIK